MVVAWLFNPLVKFLTKHKFNRFCASILVYAVFITLLVVILANSVPLLTDQLNDFINIMPTITKNIGNSLDNFVGFLEPLLNENTEQIKEELFTSIIQIGKNITVEFPIK